MDLTNIIRFLMEMRQRKRTLGKSPGMDLFNTVKEKLGELDIIAEDLGFLTESVFQLLKDSGYPGMKVLQFAFDPSEDSDYLTYKYQRNCVVYTGTHDNDTTAAGLRNFPMETKRLPCVT